MAQRISPDGDTYDHNRFFEKLDPDLMKAGRSIRILSAFGSIARIEKLAVTISSKVQAGVRVCVFLQEPQDWARRRGPSLDAVTRARLEQFEACINLLTRLGVHVNLRKRIHVKVAVIDNQILWDGSLNILSFGGSTDERMTRWDDPIKAVAAVALHKLNECALCKSASRWSEREDPVINAEDIGNRIAKRRRQLGMSLSELARRASIHRNTLADIEVGKRYPSLDAFFRISKALDKTVAWLPSAVIGNVTRLIEMEFER